MNITFQFNTIPFVDEQYISLRHVKNGFKLSCVIAEADDTNLHQILAHELTFTFKHSFLKKFAVDFPFHQFKEHREESLCCNTQMILHEIVNCKLEGVFKNMFLESKALELLICFQKCNIAIPEACLTCKFLTNKIEKDKIYKAREIILASLKNPPTIQELSLQIGINQCYLKKGFKEIFGTTVYDFVQEQRMLKAKMLLTTSAFSVSQVANEIGFSSQSNFSSAFKKFTGVLPSELQNN